MCVPSLLQLSQDPAATEMDQSPTKTGQPEQDELLSSGHFQMPYSLVRDGEGVLTVFVERHTTATAVYKDMHSFKSRRV